MSQRYLKRTLGVRNLRNLTSGVLNSLKAHTVRYAVYCIRYLHTERFPVGPRHRVTAHKEVILSAGTIGTPHILLLSGIGNATTLSSVVGVQPVLDLPSVGQNLSDHTRLGNNFFVNSTETFDQITRNATFGAEVFEAWNEEGRGPLVDTFISHLVFVRLEEGVLREIGEEPSAGPNSGHIELGISVLFFSTCVIVALFLTVPTERHRWDYVTSGRELYRGYHSRGLTHLSLVQFPLSRLFHLKPFSSIHRRLSYAEHHRPVREPAHRPSLPHHTLRHPRHAHLRPQNLPIPLRLRMVRLRSLPSWRPGERDDGRGHRRVRTEFSRDVSASGWDGGDVDEKGRVRCRRSGFEGERCGGPESG